MNNENSSITLTGLLQVVFITLKLLNVIKWSWGWVLCPIIISVALSVLNFLMIIIFSVIEQWKQE